MCKRALLGRFIDKNHRGAPSELLEYGSVGQLTYVSRKRFVSEGNCRSEYTPKKGHEVRTTTVATTTDS